MNPVHEHDCEFCTFVASYPARHSRVDPYTGEKVTMADVYLTCDPKPFYKYIVRYGVYGEYATTNVPSRYILAPMIDGIDPYA